MKEVSPHHFQIVTHIYQKHNTALHISLYPAVLTHFSSLKKINLLRTKTQYVIFLNAFYIPIMACIIVWRRLALFLYPDAEMVPSNNMLYFGTIEKLNQCWIFRCVWNCIEFLISHTYKNKVTLMCTGLKADFQYVSRPGSSMSVMHCMWLHCLFLNSQT